MEYRSYQKDCENAVNEAFKTFRRVCFCLPTGTGKTKTALDIAKDKKFLFIVHREFLATQTAKSYGKPCAIRTGKTKTGSLENSVICSVQWLSKKNIASLPDDFDIIIVDEAHHAPAKIWEKSIDLLLEINSKANLLGMTATLQRPDKKPLSKMFEHLAYFKPINYFVQNKWLALVEAHSFQCDIDTSRFSISKTTQDFVVNEKMLSAIEVSNWKEVIFDSWKQKASGEKTLAFCTSVKHSQELADYFNDKNIVAAHVDADTPTDQRRKIEADFFSGKITVLCNVAIYTEGYDVPDAVCAIMARPVLSQLFYIQCIGRVLRKSANKENAIVLEMADSKHTLVQFADLDPSQTFKSTQELLKQHGFSGGFFRGLMLSLSQRQGLVQFNRGFDVYSKAVNLLRNNKLAWGVFGERALLQTGKGEFFILPADDVDDCEGDYRCVLHSKGETEYIADSDALSILEISADHAEQYATQLSNATSKWRFDVPTQKQIESLTIKFNLSIDAIEGINRGEASLLISYLYACQSMNLEIGGDYA